MDWSMQREGQTNRCQATLPHELRWRLNAEYKMPPADAGLMSQDGSTKRLNGDLANRCRFNRTGIEAKTATGKAVIFETVYGIFVDKS